jgi:uncharacterized protein
MAMPLLRVLAILLLLAGASERASAQAAAPQAAPSADALAAANELFAILSVDMMTQLTAQVTNAFWPSVEEKARAEKIDDATIAQLRKEFDRIQLDNVSAVLKEAPPIYARHFTVSELQELAAFYRTPTGAKALRELPQVMGEFTAQFVPRMQAMQQQATDGFNRILRERGYLK